MTIYAIAAVGNNWQLGLNGGLPWPKHKADMAWFREITAGKVLIAGYNTYETIKHLDGDLGRAVIMFDSSIFPAGPVSRYNFGREIIIVGGTATYKSFAPFIDQLYLSRIDYDGPADCHFPINAFTPAQIQNAIRR